MIFPTAFSFDDQVPDDPKSVSFTIGDPVKISLTYRIKDIIKDLDNFYADDLKNIIIKQHQMILNYDLFLSTEENRRYALILFTNKTFLLAFRDVIGLLYLNSHEITCLNKLAYDYYSLPEKDTEIMNLLLAICHSANSKLVIKLSGKLGLNGAKILAMISNSSFDKRKCVTRVHDFLVKFKGAILSIQDIVDILCILYSEHFTYPFIYIMTMDKLDSMDANQIERYNFISIALLAILDSMVSNDIKYILRNYGFYLKLHDSIVVRFLLKDANQYPRILKCINDIECEELEIRIP